MKCPKHPECILVTPHECCVGSDGTSRRRRVACQYCLSVEYTHTETCSVCNGHLPWPSDWKSEINK